ncbi:hypothetical protein D3C73_1579390 [compost metagenome]
MLAYLLNVMISRSWGKIVNPSLPVRVANSGYVAQMLVLDTGIIPLPPPMNSMMAIGKAGMLAIEITLD